MDFSNCLICGSTIALHQKYCGNCLEKYNRVFLLKQGDWNTFRPKTKDGTPERRKEIQNEMEKDGF